MQCLFSAHVVVKSVLPNARYSILFHKCIAMSATPYSDRFSFGIKDCGLLFIPI